uniref:Uncharacterized protein n=3 Tax=Meloidogyne TaxID=189290 RepID=A0A915NLK1_9BILA
MESLLDSNYFERNYNCSFYDYNSIPVENRRNLIVGIILLILYVIFEVLYLPCLGVFAQKENLRESCYKLMLFMGILSMININSSGLIIGIYAIRGDVFCSRPLFNYIIGMPAFGLYCSESLIAMVLALNRCIEMYDHQLAEKIFSGNKIFYWIISSLIYGFILGFFTIPPMPNGLLVGWFWNPHIVYFQDLEGVVFLQVLLIGMLHMFVTLLYTYMQYFPVPIWIVMSASYAWITSQGLVPLIYITFNKYIRRSIKSLFIDPNITRITTHFNNSRVAPNSTHGDKNVSRIVTRNVKTNVF